MEKLKCLNLTFSKNLKRLPDFSGVPSLEKLALKGCSSLTEVHPSLVHHKKVVLVNLKDCKSLKALPGKLEMSSLKKLILSGCSEFKFLPEFWESMVHLSMLALEGTAIRKLPSSLGCLVGLEVLNLTDCQSLVCLPDTIRGLNSLRILDISGCSKLSRLPDGLKEIKCLEELNAADTSIDELPSSIFYLDNLSIIICWLQRAVDQVNKLVSSLRLDVWESTSSHWIQISTFCLESTIFDSYKFKLL